MPSFEVQHIEMADSTYPTVSPLKCGFLSPPASKFISDARLDEKMTSNSKIVFDLSIRKDLTKYHPGLQKHIATRDPLSSENDVRSALALGGLPVEEIDYVIVSHIHWDHVGTPGDFTRATFIAGHNTGKLLRNEMGPDLANPYYEPDLLPAERTIELPATPSAGGNTGVFNSERGWHWSSKQPLTDVIDMFNDGTMYIVDSPGHVPGHLNALIRVAQDKWVYLAADACHHARIFKGEVDFGSWTDEQGRKAWIHKDIDAAYRTLGIMRRLRDEGLDGVPVEVILAHDGEWEKNNAVHFFPNHL